MENLYGLFHSATQYLLSGKHTRELPVTTSPAKEPPAASAAVAPAAEATEAAPDKEEDEVALPSLQFVRAHDQPKPEYVLRQMREGVYLVYRDVVEDSYVWRPAPAPDTAPLLPQPSNTDPESGEVSVSMSVPPATSGGALMLRRSRERVNYVVAHRDTALCRFAFALERSHQHGMSNVRLLRAYLDCKRDEAYPPGMPYSTDPEEDSLEDEEDEEEFSPAELERATHDILQRYHYFEVDEAVLNAFPFVEAHHMATSNMLATLLQGRASLPTWASELVCSYVGSARSDFFLPEVYAIQALIHSKRAMDELRTVVPNPSALEPLRSQIANSIDTFDRIAAIRTFRLPSDVKPDASQPLRKNAPARGGPPPPAAPPPPYTHVSATMTVTSSPATDTK